MWESELIELAKNKNEVFIDCEEDDEEEVVEKGFNWV